MAFATTEDLATHIQKNLSAEEAATAAQILDVATQVIKDYTEQDLEAVTGRIETFRAGRGVWLLSQLPVTAISALTVEGVAFTDYDVDLRAGIISRTDDCWWNRDLVSVTYDSGFSTIPDSLKGVCLNLAGRAFKNPVGVSAQSIDGAGSVTYADSLGTGMALEADDRAILDRYRVAS